MASSSSSSHSAPVSSSRLCKYDVFISFRGEDTRKTFVDHLYSALLQKTIHTYKDDKTLLQGESISPSLVTAIEESHIALIVFSKNYANSSWCLDELAYIMKCKDERGLIVMPIFYDVEPSEVRKLKRKFGEAFATHEIENPTKVELWRKALVDASNIAGWESKIFANGHESELVKEIVDKTFCRLFPSNSAVDKDLVGMRVRLEDLKSQLKNRSDCVRMVGIWGLGGAGKTTLATAVYMEISHLYEGSCLLENIQGESCKYDLRKLQGNILSAIFNGEVKVNSVGEGKQKIRSMLCGRKVLVVLDDVHTLEQLEALAGSCDWFGSGSRIIITTRDKHLLNAHKVDDVYPVTLLSADEAILLFNKHAYNEENPIKDYKKHSSYVVSYAAGLPLALKVLGSFLYDKDEKGWISALERLKDIPEEEIVEKLKISYDGLKKVEKELFLDIACFFRSTWTEDKMEILDACGFHPEIGIEVLRQKALITINEYGRFDMHDLVQEMAHYIIRGENPSSFENHSRVWEVEKIDNICFGDATMENDKIEAIPYDYKDRSSHICKLVSNMKRLRWLSVETHDDRNDHRGPTFLSSELRYIYWRCYLGSSFPDSFQPMQLVVLKLSNSMHKDLWKRKTHLPHLKVLQLYRMKNLARTPDFKGLPCLQKLTLKFCDKLEEIHPSLGNNTSLEYVLVSWCEKLRMFPRIVHMQKLKTLEINYCRAIRELPKILANMESLVNLSLSFSNIVVVPSSIGEYCTNLVSLHLKGCYKLKRIEFDLGALKHLEEFTFRLTQKTPVQLIEAQFPRSLRKLILCECRLEDGEIPFEIGELSNLEELDLSSNHFIRLALNLLQLTRLKWLNLRCCRRLVELPELPSSVAILQADYCNSLRAVGDVNRNCRWLCGVSLVAEKSPINDGSRLLESMLQGKAIENGTMLLRVEGVEIAKGFTPGLHKGDKFRLQLPENWSNDFCGFLICFVFARGSSFWRNDVWISMKDFSGMDSQHDHDVDVDWKEGDGGNLTWVGYVSLASLRQTSWWHQTYNNLSFHIQDPSVRSGCRGIGVRLIERKSGSQQPTEASSTHSSDFSHYTPTFNILYDSAHALSMSLNLRYY